MPTIIPGQANQQTAATNSTPSAQSAKERAIAIIQKGNASVADSGTNTPAEVLLAQSQASQQTEDKGQNNSVEKSSESPKEATQAKEDPLSTQYALLARKEKALRSKAQAQDSALKTREEAIRAREEALKAKDVEYQSNYIPKNRLTENTIETLLEAGITYDQITQMALNQSQVQQDPATQLAIKRLEAQIKAQAEQQEKAAKAYEESQSVQYKQAVNQITQEVKNLVKSDDFEVIRATNSVSDVVDLIEKTFKADGILLSVEEAAREVEEYLVDEALKLSELKKIQQRKKPVTQAPKQTEQPKQQSQTMKTLTNAVGTSRPLTAKERAVLAFKNELK